MVRTAFRLPFRLFGIPVHFDVSFLIILPLLAWIIASRIEVGAMEAFKKIRANDFERLLVMNEREEPLGMLSRSDLMKTIQIQMVQADKNG